jgi:hypothetical protein
VLEQNIVVAPSLQLFSQSTYFADEDLCNKQYAIISDIEKMDDVLSLLNNYLILESMIMKSMSPLSDKSMARLIPAAYLQAFIRVNKNLVSDNFHRVHLRQICLYSYAIKILKYNNYPGCEFLKD